jgi:hypothetical protein
MTWARSTALAIGTIFSAFFLLIGLGELISDNDAGPLSLDELPLFVSVFGGMILGTAISYKWERVGAPILIVSAVFNAVGFLFKDLGFARYLYVLAIFTLPPLVAGVLLLLHSRKRSTTG